MSDWWASLRHGGLLIAPSKIAEYFPDRPEPLPTWLEERLRRDVTRVGVEDGSARLLDTVLERVIGLGLGADWDSGEWRKGAALAGQWSRRAATGEMVRPARLWQGPRDAVLPVFVDDSGKRLGIGKGKRAAARVVEWLRRTEQRVALLTNARQWRLIHAGLDHEAFAEWDVDLWFQEGVAGPQVDALRQLLSRRSLVPGKDGGPARLLAAIEASRKGQAELSSVLGERVRQAVEVLIREYGPALAGLGEGVGPRDIYRAATRVIMRLVVLLFSEALDLLPREDALYHGSYGLQGLREALDRVGGGSAAERLRSRPPSAWPRVLALFRLVYEGSPHEAMPVRRYGGALFEPGDPASADPVRRALAVLEDPGRECVPTDAAVRTLLELLSRSKVRVRQGKGSVWVDAPVDFAGLSSEYIGILYEGLLDFELRHAAVEDPVVFLAVGDEPALPLSRLESMDEAGLKSLVEKFKKPAKADAGDEEEAEEEADGEGEEPEAEEAAEEASPEEPETEEAADDRRRAARERAVRWALQAVDAGKLVKKPTSKKPEALAKFEADRQAAAQALIRRVVLPGEWYLVRFGGTRKGSGTFYTRPQLAVPTVHRTLQPLLYATSAEGEDTPRAPGEILSRKVCDPACGSGSFLIATLRYLAEALWKSLLHHRWLTEAGDRLEVTLEEGARPAWFADCVRALPVDAEDAASRIRARLRRHVVEHCLYGVDLDPLAVELCRVALWVETMNRELPFTFLDHKVKAGNSLVGCWFDRFGDYPVLAWEREGGDKSHTTGVHYPKEGWTKALKEFKNQRVKPDLQAWIATRGRQHLMIHALEGSAPEVVHDEAAALFERLHAYPVDDPEAQARFYREEVEASPALRELREAFDRWCAVWFWPADQLEHAPLPRQFHAPSEETRALTRELWERHRFFHWELEFPDVFRGPGTGFDGIVGNPPWDIQKPNSKEFFSNVDPLYRTYGKQEALARQTALFEARRADETAWLAYNADFKAMSNLVKQVHSPFGDGADGGEKMSLGKGGEALQATWKEHRRRRKGYADPNHPFRHQGSADLNSYKLFLEQNYRLLAQDGHLGLIVPSGVYTDKGTSGLRELFLDRSRWRWLFGFENREGIFPDVDGRFKFCPVVVQKGGETEAIATAFMQRDLRDWEEAERHAIPYTRQQVLRFSPNTRAVLELRSRRDLEILEKIYRNSVLLGDDGPDGWGVQYAREFDMTTDSKLFPPRPKWEEQGYRPDEYGRWLLGGWRKREQGCPAPPGAARWQLEPGVVLSRDGGEWVHESDVRDVALPLYEGRMIGQFDFSEKGWVSGKGRTAVWREISWAEKTLEPQFLMAQETFRTSSESAPTFGDSLRCCYMDVTSSTNQRTMISSVVSGAPCGNKVPLLLTRESDANLALAAVLNSFVYDYQMRGRLGGLTVNYFIAEETALPPFSAQTVALLSRYGLMLTGVAEIYSPSWLRARMTGTAWRTLWALGRAERLRLRCKLDAILAALYGMDMQDLTWVFRDCDHPMELSVQQSFTRTLDAKGFWRVGKDQPPELRHTVLTLAAFHDLKETIRAHGGDLHQGIAAFCSQNDGEGWMLPETLCLADLGLGHDQRARKPQPVREALGERFYPFQLEQSVEDSWAECRLHARNLLGELEYRRLLRDLEDGDPGQEGGGGTRRPSRPRPPGSGPTPYHGDVAAEGQGYLFEDQGPKGRQGKLWD